MKHVGKILMYMDSARDSKLLSFENDERLQIWGFLGTRETGLKKKKKRVVLLNGSLQN